jgi:hypothetical protein
MNTPASHYQLLFDTGNRRLSTIIDQDISGVPYSAFRQCRPLPADAKKQLANCRLYTRDIDQLGDYIQNSFGWPLCSTAFADCVGSLAGDGVEVVAAPPLIDKKKRTADDRLLLNPLACLPCIDLGRSRVSRDQDGQIVGIYEVAFDSARLLPPSAHLFRAAEWMFPLFVSHALAQAMTRRGLTGMAFLPIV